MINKGIKISCSLPESYSKIPLVMNHYYTKSHEEYINKCKLWSISPVNLLGRRTDNCSDMRIFKEKDVNEIMDKRILSQ